MPAPKIKSDTIEKSYFKIGEVAALLQVNVSLIRFWEKEFPQIKPSKTEKGDRKFSRSDVALLQQIYQLVKVEGHTLQGAREKLKINTDNKQQQVIQKLIDLKNYLNELKSTL
jgi:DNA-binding transcriptional MerR regulator